MRPCQVIYKSVFVYDDSRDTIAYHEPGLFGWQDDRYIIRFSADEKEIDISYHETHVRLSHGVSVLNFDVNRDIVNDYQMAYGVAKLKTRVVSLTSSDTALKFVYELYQGNEKIARVYLMVRVIEEEQEWASS